jgi:hypothetical protein
MSSLGYYSNNLNFKSMKKSLCTVFAVVLLVAASMAQNFNWVKQIGGTANNYGLLIKKDVQNNIIIVGYYFGTIDLDPGVGVVNVTSVGSQDIFVVKLDSIGNFIWGKSVGGSNIEYPRSLVIDNNNNILLGGYFRQTADFDPSSAIFNLSTGNPGADGFILKLSPDGNFVYAKQIGGVSSVDDDLLGIAIDNQGNLYATGYFNLTCDLDPGPGSFTATSTGSSDIFIIKLDSTGSFIFAKTIGGVTGGTVTCVGRTILIDSFNDVIITGSFDAMQDFDPNAGIFTLVSNGLMDIFLLKLTSSGNFVFAKAFGGPGNDYGSSVSFDDHYDVLLAGVFDGTVDFDPDAGVSNRTSNGLSDGFLLKLNGTGNYVWCNQIGGVGNDQISDVSLDSRDNIYITGFFSDSVDFDNTSSIYKLHSNGMKDAFLASFGESGNLHYAQNYGSSMDDEGIHLYASSNEVDVTGYFQNTVDFDASSSTNNLISAGGADAFLLSIKNELSDGINSKINYSEVKAFPNPASSHLNIDYGDYTLLHGCQVRIVNALGLEIYKSPITQASDYLDISAWGGKGIYFLYIINPSSKTINTQKIILN